MSAATAGPRMSGARGIGLLVALTFTAVAVLVTAWFPYREHQNGLAALEHKAKNQAELIAYTIAPAIDFGDTSMVGEVFRGAARDEDFVGVVARGSDGATIVSHGDARRGRGVAVTVPITTPSGDAGTLTLVMSTTRVDEESRSQLEVAAAIGGTILLFGIFVGAFVSRSIGRIATLTDEGIRASATAEQERVKARFLANMSHEIRTPLNGVIGLADVLSRRSLDPQASALVASIVRSARNLLGLINDVLDLSRLESGRLEIEHARFDPELSAVTVCETLTSTAHERGLELVLDVGEEVPASVDGDRLRYEQVLTNLVGNALKFTPSGCVVVELRFADGTLDSRVRDTGIGIPADKLEAIFEAFAQADASTTRRFGGTGLGLTISRELVRLMGGDLRVESVEGKGSAFSFDVKVASLEAAPQLTLSRPPSRMLVVSRDPEVGPLLVRCAKHHGIAVELLEPEDLAKRIASLGSAEADSMPVVLWDAALGALGGDARAAVSDAVGSGRAVLVLHASAVDPHHDDLLASTLVTKPFSRATFASTLDGVRAPTSRPQPRSESSGPRTRLLVAEDDATNRLVVTNLLGELGLDADVVGTGRDAVTAVELRGPYALVLMDCQMPVMDGYEASRRIRAREKERGVPPIPIVAVTAHASAEDRARADAAGMNGYVTKPLTLDSFRDGVRPLLPEGVVIDESAAVSATPSSKLALTFRRSSDEGIEAIGHALGRGDLGAVAREAHRLKGSCLAVAEQDPARIAADLEARARSGDAEECAQLAVELELALADAGARLETA